MVMLLSMCCVVMFIVSAQAGIAMHPGFPQESEMVIDQKMLVQLVRRVENLEKRDQDQQTEIDSLRGELNTEKVKTARLEGRVSRLQASLGVWLRTGAKTTDRTSGDVPMATPPEPNRVNARSAVTSETSGIQPMPSRIRRQAEIPAIAFHATLSKTLTHTGVRQSIAFDRVVTNIGNAYNPHFGAFIAPVSGVYVFHTTIQGWGHSSTRISLVKNGSSVARMYVDGGPSFGTSGSAMAVLHMTKGDDVAVQNNYTDVDIDGAHYSHFSGFLLHMDGEDTTIVG